MVVAVIGSRSFSDYDTLKKILDDDKDITSIVSGGAAGADSLAIQYAKEKDIPYTIFEADWGDITHPNALIKVNKYGKQYDARAGFRRNDLIIESCDKVIAFHDEKSTGTIDSITKAKRLNKKIKIVKYLFL